MSTVIARVLDALPDAESEPTTSRRLADKLALPIANVLTSLTNLEKTGKAWKLSANGCGDTDGCTFMWAKADQTGYVRLISQAEAEVEDILSTDPRFVTAGVLLTADGRLDMLYDMAERYPNPIEPFRHFYVVWSFAHQSFVLEPECFHVDPNDAAITVKTFDDPEVGMEWLLSDGVSLLRKRELPDGQPLPTSPPHSMPAIAIARSESPDRWQHIDVS